MEEEKKEEKTKKKYPILVLIIGAIFILGSLAFVVVPMLTTKKDNNTNNNENIDNGQKEEKKKTDFDLNKVFTLIINSDDGKIIRYNGTIEDIDIRMYNYNDEGYAFNDKVIYYHAKDKKLHKYDIATKEDTNLGIDLPHNFSSMALTDDYLYLITTDTFDGNKYIYNLETKELKEIDIHTNNVLIYAYKNKLVYKDLNNGTYIYDPATNSTEAIVSDKKYIVLPMYSYGSRVVYGENDHGDIDFFIYDIDTKKTTKVKYNHLGKYNINEHNVTDDNGKELFNLGELSHETFKVVGDDYIVIKEYEAVTQCLDDICMPDSDTFTYYLLDTKVFTLDKIYHGYLYK